MLIMEDLIEGKMFMKKVRNRKKKRRKGGNETRNADLEWRS